MVRRQQTARKGKIMKKKIIIKTAAFVSAVLLSAGVVSLPVCQDTGFAITAEAASSKLAAPSYAFCSKKSSDSAELMWGSVSGADAYRVYKYNASSKKYESYKTVKGTSCTVTGLKPGKSYSFKVAALKKSNGKYVAGTKSETVKVKTLKAFKAGDTVSCSLFSITLPAGADYVVEKEKNSISVYDREAKESNWGGFAFNVTAYAKPSDYSGMMDAKIGEMTTSSGKVYDIVVRYPSDVQYDVEKYSDMPANYESLYYGSEDILKTLESGKGGSYVAGAGMKGEELYGDVLAKYKTALDEKWDSNKLEDEDMSPVYNQIAQSEKGSILSKVGYAYSDLNGDGIDELLIGEVAKGSKANMVYDIYTMADRKPVHAASGWFRSSMYLFEYGMIANVYSSSAYESGVRILEVVHNEAALSTQQDFRYDYSADEENPWFIYYLDDEEGEKVSEEDFNQRMSNYGDFIHIDFTPFSSLK